MSDKKIIVSTIGTLAALSFSLGTFAGEPEQTNPFDAEELHNGFMVAEANLAEGACGEGTCGEGSCGEDDDDNDNDDKDEEGACGEGTCGVA